MTNSTTIPADTAVGISRRAALLIGGSGTAVALVGCSTGPAATGDAAATDQEGGPKSATEVAKLADIPVGGSVEASLNGKPILVSQPTAGKVIAFSAVCTHRGCVVKPVGKEFDCPCHGSKFDAMTGEVLGGPAPSPLVAVPVTVTGDSVTAT
ncbi:Rieske (2Fe-2S) protein [Cryobacterium mannosilyticum]|uniref:Cytochrome bc1 complex Rieske iron-sulfur subunit n=1 Tax=Cryobacterium mannosilyticum TaxID=1259190 RepID=A0A4R8WFX4_9MICO|nr:Rieske (2Fe-2S) protein [Cryobacterium mannosilyticum]TFC06844.1 Rieske (2Fe-2S) protein [Cryobacterium mannosilyticum]